MLNLGHCISSYSFLPWIVSLPQWGNYSSFYYIREKVKRKLFEIFKVLKFQKRIVAQATIWGNTVCIILYNQPKRLCQKSFIHFLRIFFGKYMIFKLAYWNAFIFAIEKLFKIKWINHLNIWISRRWRLSVQSLGHIWTPIIQF